MANAGIKLPSRSQRIWTWIKDHPKAPAKTISAELRLNAGEVQTLLWNMTQRKMLEWVQEAHMTAGGKTKQIRFYSVAPSMRGQYELLPLPVKGKTPAKVSALPAAPRPPMTGAADTPTAPQRVVAASAPSTPGRLTAEAAMDILSVNEAKRLYELLRTVFEQR